MDDAPAERGPSPANAGAQSPAPDWTPAFAGEGPVWFDLVPHRQHPPTSVRGVTVDVQRHREGLRLAYCVDGTERVVFPADSIPTRTDDLWRTTCFELFLQFDDGERYVEFNFSPSTRWAAYAFDGYREGMTDLAIDSPGIERTPNGLTATVDLTGLPRGKHRMGLSAVIEETDGIKSYWALAHPPGEPDFHHPACFAARLPPPDAQ